MPYFREIYPIPAAYMISKLGVKWGLELMNREVNGTTVKMSRFMVIGLIIIAAKFSMYVNLIKTA